MRWAFSLDDDGTGSALLSSRTPQSYKACSSEDLNLDEEDDGWGLRQACQAILAHPWFEPVMVLVSLVDALVVGLEIDWPDLFSHAGWLWVAAALNLFFSAEVTVRLKAEGLATLRTLSGASLTLVVVFGWLELVMAIVVDTLWPPGDMRRVLLQVPGSLIQVLRILRVGRITSTATSCSELLSSLVLALPELGWVMTLSLLFFFCSACAATLIIGRGADGPSDLPSETFDNIGDSMFTLLQLALIEGWPDVVRPMLQDHWEWVPPLLAFILIANCGLMNLLTAVMVERTMHARQREQAAQWQKQTTEERQLIAALHSQLEDFSGGPTITRERFTEWLFHSIQSTKTLDQLGLSRTFMLSTYSFCDLDKRGEVSLRNLKRVWEDCMQGLTMANCVRFRHHLALRVDHIEQLNSTLVTAVGHLAAQKASGSRAPSKSSGTNTQTPRGEEGGE